jgi:hypothetical protein
MGKKSNNRHFFGPNIFAGMERVLYLACVCGCFVDRVRGHTRFRLANTNVHCLAGIDISCVGLVVLEADREIAHARDSKRFSEASAAIS